jgi:excisionase family DNA binding protein
MKRLELRQPEARKGQLSNLLNEPLLNADEAAQLLHVPRSTLYELVRSRHLPHVRMGRSLRFTRVQLKRWVDENTFW